MSDSTMVKLHAGDLDALRTRAALPPPAAAAVDGCETPAAAVARLVEGGFLIEASRLVAHALPKREAVWWASMCAGHTEPPDLAPPDRRALEAAQLWVRKPSDENRRAAFDRAQETAFGSPEVWAAVGAFWSGGSMAPPGQADVPPPAHLTGTAVAGAVALASVRGRPEWQKQRLLKFLDSARDIAAGGPGRLPHEAG